MKALVTNEIKHGGEYSPHSIVISPENKFVVGTFYKVAKMFDINTSKLVREFKGHASNIWTLKFSPNGKYLFTGSYEGELKVWHVNNYHNDTIKCNAICTINEHTCCIDVSSDNKYFVTASGDRTCKLFNLPGDVERITSSIRTVTVCQHKAAVSSVAFTHDVKFIVTGSYDNLVRIWNVADGRKVHTLKRHTGYVYCVAPSFDGTHVVSGSADGNVFVWDMKTGEFKKKFNVENGGVGGVAISNDNNLIFANAGGKLKILDANTSNVLETFDTCATYLNSVGLSSNNELLALTTETSLKILDVTPHLPWTLVASTIMLRWLCEQNRAVLGEDESSLDLLVLDSSDDVFYYAISFLNHPIV